MAADTTKSNKLDELILQQLQLVDNILETRRSISSIFRDGLFELLQAKVTMGSTTVSQAFYDSRMTANSLVSISETNEKISFSLVRLSDKPLDEPKDKQATERDPPESKPLVTAPDPLKWFGILVSPHLRKCQQHFVHALPLLIELASLQAELAYLQSQQNALT